MDKKKTQVSVLFMLFSILFCVCLIAANVLETKQIAFGPISLTGGLIVFPVSYIINDVICEVWGYQKARLLIRTGFAMNFFFVALGAICDVIPAAPYWTNDAGFHAIFGLKTPHCSSLFRSLHHRFVCQCLCNERDEKSAMAASISLPVPSSVPLQVRVATVLSSSHLPWAVWCACIRIALAHARQVILKTAYEIVVLPLTIRVVKYVKKHEGEDAYDNNISYNVFKIFSLG